MGLQGIAVVLTTLITAVATVGYMIIQRRRYLTNNPNAVGDNFDVFRNPTCPICLESFGTNSVILNCGHELHQQCLTELNNHRGYLSTNRCPVCRTPIRLE